MTINMALDNVALYEGCKIQEVAGRLNLVTPEEEGIQIVGRNAKKIVDAVPAGERDEVTLTGPMAIWAYLVVFHQVLHTFKKVSMNTGRKQLLLAAHG